MREEDLLTILASGNVCRWHREELPAQSVAAHSWRACIIAWGLGASKEVIEALMFHDVDELYTGDIPADMKWQAPEDFRRILHSMSMKWREANSVPEPWLNDRRQKLLKLADWSEALLYCVEQRRQGNQCAALIFWRLFYRCEDLAFDKHHTDWINRLAIEWEAAGGPFIEREQLEEKEGI